MSSSTPSSLYLFMMRLAIINDHCIRWCSHPRFACASFFIIFVRLPRLISFLSPTARVPLPVGLLFSPTHHPIFFFLHLPRYPLSRIDCFELRGDSAFVAAPLVRRPSLVLPCSHYVTLGNHSVNVQWGHPSFNWHVQLPCSTPNG